MSWRHLLRVICLFASLAGALTQAQATAPPLTVTTPHLTAELVSLHTSLHAGSSNTLGLRLKHQPHWHTYWRNPGDAGQATEIKLSSPKGYVISDIIWPAPKRIPVGPLMSFAYENEVVLPFTLTVPAHASGTIDLEAKAAWLVCKDICVPEEATLTLSLPVNTQRISGPYLTLFNEAAARTPKAADFPTQVANESTVHIRLKPGLGDVSYFPYSESWMEPAAKQEFRGDRLSLKKIASGKFDHADGVVVSDAGVFEIKPQLVTTLGPQTPAAEKFDLGFVSALLLAFLGGMVLNLMPCVFPVLSIKILSLVQHQNNLKIHGLIYTLGVVLSFVGLAGLMLILRATGEQIGWGFQLQNPEVVFVLSLLFFLIALNLFGLFELGNFLPSSLANAEHAHPALDAFFTGVLAVLAASPCTAPFMGAALGYALSLSAPAALLIFASLGLGLAFPYLLLCYYPALLKRLPKPGAWMNTLKQALAVPMLITVVWLLWVIGLQTSHEQVAKVLLTLIAVFATLFFVHQRSGLKTKILLLLASAATMLWAWPTASTAPTALTSPTSLTSPSSSTPNSSAWQNFDPQRLAKEVAEGKTVFVDFTAAWCVSCQVNKQTVLNAVSTQQLFVDKKVLLMRADWTRRDPVISKAIESLGRNGVPVYALYRPGQPVALLPEVLTFGILENALKDL
ncbi:MAG: hypothetical protein RLZZ502_1458 [Pseudomonadota bacterium]